MSPNADTPDSVVSVAQRWLRLVKLLLTIAVASVTLAKLLGLL